MRGVSRCVNVQIYKNTTDTTSEPDPTAYFLICFANRSLRADVDGLADSVDGSGQVADHAHQGLQDPQGEVR